VNEWKAGVVPSDVTTREPSMVPDRFNIVPNSFRMFSYQNSCNARFRLFLKTSVLSARGHHMTVPELIAATLNIIGAGRKDDYKIQPTAHAAELASKAPALATILAKAQFSVLAEQYERKDQEAVEGQEAFRSAVGRANWAVFFTTVFSVLLLVASPLTSIVKTPHNTLLVVFGVGGIVCGGLGAMWLYQVREGKLLDSWMNARATAELLRKQYFEAVTSAQAVAEGSDVPALLLQFEYFRRYHFDTQVAFYDRRCVDYKRAAARVLRATGLSVGLASISLGLAGFLGGIDPRWTSAAALGTVATAIAAFASTNESVYHYRRNLELYGKTGDALRLFKGKLDDVRAAAIAGEREPVQQFVAAINEQLVAEHRQWLAAAQDVQPALERLDDTLSKLKSNPGNTTTTAGT
jgi:cytochrome c biogenesis protein CcdA